MGTLTDLGRRAPGGVERWFAAQGAPPALDLARSGAAPLRLGEVLDLHPSAALDELLAVSLDYGAGRGEPRFRAAVAAAGGARRGAEVLVTHGAAEALLLACAVAPRRHGAALVASPAYDGLLAAPRAAGLRVHRVPVWGEQHPGRLRIGRLLAALERGGVDLVLVNTPHNPTGLRLGADDLDRLGRACRAAGALLVVDEVARGTLDPGAPSAVATPSFAAGTLVVAGDVSKSLGLGGLRCGWLTAASPALLRRAAAVKETTTVTNARPAQLLAALALEAAGPLLHRTATWAMRNREVLGGLVEGCAGSWAPPVDGLVAFPWLPLTEPASAAAARLRRERGVAVLPGSLFGHPGRLRLGLGLEPGLFAAALERIAAAVVRRAA